MSNDESEFNFLKIVLAANWRVDLRGMRVDIRQVKDGVTWPEVEQWC